MCKYQFVEWRLWGHHSPLKDWINNVIIEEKTHNIIALFAFINLNIRDTKIDTNNSGCDLQSKDEVYSISASEK